MSDPRLAYEAALARRMAQQPEAVRRLLEDKLRSVRSAPMAEVAKPATSAPPPASPLAALNDHIRRVTAARAGAGPEPGSANELPSVQRFRLAWNRGRTLDQLEQAWSRKPANAGPLNSHALVLRTLGLMQDLSTDYLQRFIVQVETLQWLERARDAYPREATKVAKVRRSARARK